MTDLSARLALPLLQAGQAQKEIYHNEALALLDIVVAAAVQAIGTNDPPATPALGACWIVGSAPTGAWTGHSDAIAGWTAGGWRFAAPRDGMSVWIVGDGVWARRAGGSWLSGSVPATSLAIGNVQVVGSRQPAIPTPAGGTTVDAEARSATASILAAMRTHGLIAT